MRIVVPRETAPGERRVAMAPGSVKRLVSGGVAVAVETGAGLAASFTDEEYREAGAEIIADPGALFQAADFVGKINVPQVRDDGFDEIAAMPSGTLCVAMLQPYANSAALDRLAAQGVTSVALELIPRTTKAQRMDALSAFSTIAGYAGVIRGAEELGKFFPMLTTAAGTIAPARVFILGAGVAGLQAIATARRLGAVVEAFDIRPVVKEQVESLGAKFVEWNEADEGRETEGGYAEEVSESEAERERQLLSDHIAKSDLVITTALVPGRPAPRLITEDMVRRMRPGSVIVDFAAEAGGNCELTVAGETVRRHGVSIMGPLDLASSLPVPGSEMYGRILAALIEHASNEDGILEIDLNDPILDASVVTHGGKVRFEA
ncbi:MAG: Re/Si-specific NAD(P)(+) transhydrogenase subunit alpha [Gemmatimonadota bacterium]|nr:Re/Si-specific NAD(P)(+) transhydrogenase subunit alpha [Gemmatimonadota bacterium]MDH3427617.1 Re/Si-specific NAD(P)(+) transhydrogenase subunit alpha [Gemmatimonadota bacterium]